MSDQQNQDEPSMEEILASIRRIISEDDPEEGQGEEEVAAEPEAAAEEGSDDEEDELELTEKVEVEAPAEEAAAPEEDVEVEAVEEEIPEPKPIFDEGDAEEAPTPEPEIELEAEPEPELEAVEDEAQEPDVALELDDELLEENKSDGGESLISEPTQVAASSALSEIAKAALTQRALAIGDGRTLEDLVREALRPELKLWLDAHLASMVERIVREEIKKMVRRVENQ